MTDVTVQLEERDRHIARKQAEKRLESFEQDPHWDVDKKTFGVDAYDRAFQGLMGELAFAEYAGLTIDANEYEKTDKGADFTVKYRGERCTIDVKTAKNEPYALMVKEGTASADYYVLGHVDDLTVTFYGMAAGEDVRATELSETPYDHRNHEIPVEELEPIPESEALKPIG